jgi:hypothetical protein
MRVSRSDPRPRMLAAAGLLLGIGGLVFFVLAVTRSGRFSSDSSPLQPADAEFNVGDAAARAAAIERDQTPLLFQDPADFQRPIWVNHLGDDDADGWYAFAAAIDSCTVEWDVDAGEFVDCDGARYASDGAGLPQFEVRVEDGEVIVDLAPDVPTTTSPPTTVVESGG